MRLVLASFLALFVFNLTAQQTQSPTSSPSHRVKHQENSNSDKGNAGGIAQPLADEGCGNVVSFVEKNCSEQNDERGKESSYWDKVVSPEIFPIWIASAVAIIGIIVAVFTLKAIRDEAKEIKSVADAASDNASAAKAGAEAASLNAQAAINAERAWIVIEISGPNNVGGYMCNVRNYGRTPAAMTAQHVGFIFPANEEEIPQMIDDGKYVVRAFADPIIVTPGAVRAIHSWTVGPELPQDKIDGAQRGRHLVVYFGTIFYRDILGIDHLTRFCYRLSPKEWTMSICGPKGCNEYT